MGLARRHGAASTAAKDALLHLLFHMTVPQASRIGRRAGQLARRPGAASTAGKVVRQQLAGAIRKQDATLGVVMQSAPTMWTRRVTELSRVAIASSGSTRNRQRQRACRTLSH